MPAVSTILLAGTAAASIGMGVKKSRDASKMMKSAQSKIDSYERQTLTNTLAGVETPYQMYEAETRQVRQRAADAAAAASEAGARGMALLPAIQDNEFEQQEVVNARLEQNLYQLKLAQAQEEQRIQQMTERREQEELAGYGALYEAGRQTGYSAAGDIIGGVQSVGGILGQSQMNRAVRGYLHNNPGAASVSPSIAPYDPFHVPLTSPGLNGVTNTSKGFGDNNMGATISTSLSNINDYGREMSYPSYRLLPEEIY